jgi:hypothetical protein
MFVSPHLHVSMSHVEKLADPPVLLLPIYPPLTSAGTIPGGLACSAVPEMETRRCYGATDDAALGHDCYWSGLEWSGGSVMQRDPGEDRTVSNL